MPARGAQPEEQSRPNLPDLAIRAASAGVLAAAALLVAYAGLWPFVALVALGGVVVAWEWTRLVRDGALGAPFLVLAATVVTVSPLAAVGEPSSALLAIAGGAILTAALTVREGTAGWMALGAIYFGLPAAALVYIRTDPDYGALAIAFVFVAIWSADIGAYLFGRLIGGPKLAPTVSPGKTWAGVAGGLAVPGVLVLALAYWFGAATPLGVAALTLVLAAIAQAGDLAESAVKRAFRVKDMGGLIPGHGGLLDRVDGLIFAAVAAAAVAGLRDAEQPGRGLLFWS